MAWPALRRDVETTLGRGVATLLDRQTADGRWPDFELQAGTSDAWTTAWVGWCLAGCGEAAEGARRRAAAAIAGLATPAGWGYNRATEADGDSTAWAVRFLATVSELDRSSAQAALRAYVDSGGGGRTFPDRSTSWGAAHPDVTAMIGLALLAADAPGELVGRVRRAVLALREAGGAWHAFWWATDAYATAWSLALLTVSGGVPPDVRDDAERWLESVSSKPPLSAFEAAFNLLATVWMGRAESPSAVALVNDLLELESFGWPPSPVLFVPAHDASSPGFRGLPHPDVNGAVTTAICCAALRRWRASVA